MKVFLQDISEFREIKMIRGNQAAGDGTIIGLEESENINFNLLKHLFNKTL